MLFPKALFLATAFPKIDKNSVLLLNFYQKCQNFLKISQQFVFIVKTREKLTLSFLNFVENRLKLFMFLLFYQENFENFLKITQTIVFSSKARKFNAEF